MQNRKQLDKDINLIGSFKGLAQAYEEISVTRMQRIRGKVLSSREFLNELSAVFEDVKGNYRSEIERLIRHDKGVMSYSNMKKNGKTIDVFLSSNNKLYGDIGKKVYRLFIEDIKKSDADIYVIGKVGRELYENSGLKKEYRYIDFPDTKEIAQQFEEVLKILEQYENVNVYHGQFVNVITQIPITTNVSGTKKLQETTEGKREVKFFFEPSLKDVLTIFENEIFSSLFRQTLHESELSHVTSRIQQMEFALENIESFQKDLEKKRKLVIKRHEAAKRLQRFAGISLWR